MAKTDFKSVTEYIASKPKDAQASLKLVRGAIRNAVPAAAPAQGNVSTDAVHAMIRARTVGFVPSFFATGKRTVAIIVEVAVPEPT